MKPVSDNTKGKCNVARTVRDNQLETRTARLRLKVRKMPYFRGLEEGLALGYRRNQGGGVWVARLYHGQGRYSFPALGAADDMADPDGVAILSFSQAQVAARRLHVGAARAAVGLPIETVGGYT